MVTLRQRNKQVRRLEVILRDNPDISADALIRKFAAMNEPKTEKQN